MWGLRVRAVGPRLYNMRAIKADWEVERLVRAVEITGEGIREAAAHLRPGISEVELVARFEFALRMRGVVPAYPGTFAWHGNTPDYFNDTLVMLWIDHEGQHHVREFPGHTDVGARDFGENSSSSLRPNRRYHHINGWHRSTYNALYMIDEGYRVRDDTNHNGHWDSDRNGWLPPRTADDHDRIAARTISTPVR